VELSQNGLFLGLATWAQEDGAALGEAEGITFAVDDSDLAEVAS